MPGSVTGALMGDPGFGPSPSARAFDPQPRSWATRLQILDAPIADAPALPQGQVAHAEAAAVNEPEVTSDRLRPVQAITAPLKPGQAPTGPPVFMDVAPADLLIDGRYQRDLSARGLKLIGRIVEGWDWCRFKAPTCAWTDAGLVVLDGQHTAIAAATHGGFATIPIMVVEAAEVRAQASAFVGINKDRLALHPVQVHIAAVQAGDPDAVVIQRVCDAAGLALVKNPYGARRYKVGETIAIATVAHLIQERGEGVAAETLGILARAGLAPVTKDQIRAVDELLVNPEYASEIKPADLQVAISKTQASADKEARRFAADHSAPYWRGLVHVWFRATRKRKIV